MLQIEMNCIIKELQRNGIIKTIFVHPCNERAAFEESLWVSRGAFLTPQTDASAASNVL